MEPSHQLADAAWLSLAAILVFAMQAGFACLESGLVRAKNSINVVIKNLVDFLIAAFSFWLVGFGLMFGASWNGLVGTTTFFYQGTGSTWFQAFFFFQMMFCGTATTIVSGAVAERMRFAGYFVCAAILSTLIYPLAGHWIWGGADLGHPTGWLAALGFIDFAGSTVVHSVGGWISLAAILVIGPRTGRFKPEAVEIEGHNLPIAVLGIFLLWAGWFGFNAGSTLKVSGDIPRILINTVLAPVAAGLAALLMTWVWHRKPKVDLIMNGVLAGLVGITAPCHVVGPAGALFIGAVSGVLLFGGIRALEGSNNLNSSCCDKLLAGAQAVVPFTMKLVPLEGQFSKLFVRHLEPRFVGILVQLGANVEPCFGGRAADQIDHDLAADQGASAPVVGDVAEHPMFDRVPLAGSGWKVTDLDLNAELIGQLLQLAFPQADPIPVGAATIRRNQHAAGLGIAWMTHFFPPAPDAFDGEFARVVIDPNADPPLIGCDIVDAVGRDLAEVRINEIIDTNFLRLSFWVPFLATVLEIADQFLLLGVD